MNRLYALAVALLLVGQEVYAEVRPYVGGAVGLGVQYLNDDEDNATASQLAKVEAGFQFTSFFSAGVNMYGWGVGNDDKAEDAVSFEGLSGGWDAMLTLPLTADETPPGPYLRYGGHCWAASITGITQPWSKTGCSDLTAIGFAIPGDNRRRGSGVFYFEFSRTRFDEVTSGSIVAGIKSLF